MGFFLSIAQIEFIEKVVCNAGVETVKRGRCAIFLMKICIAFIISSG